MKIIVVGCGKTGSTILSALLAEGHEVVAMDNDPAVITEITNIYDVICVCGSGTDCETLAEANVDKADLVVSTTESDEFNMLCCFLARKMGAKHTIARIRNPEYNDESLGFMKQQLSLSLAVNPELLAAQELYRILQLPSALNIETFSRRNFEMVELSVKPDSKLADVKLSELRRTVEAKFLVCAVQRGSDVYIPDGNFTLLAGDRIALAAAPNELHKLLKSLGLLRKQARSVMILGASKTAFYLAKMLVASGTDVKVIDRNEKPLAELNETINGVMTILGDGSRQELLLEEGVASTDAFVSLTGLDEANILVSCYALSQNVPTVITKVNREELFPMANRLGLDCLVSPKKSAAEIVVRYARGLSSKRGSKMESMYRVMGDCAEAMEFIVGEDFRHTGIPLREMHFKPNTLIAGILRGRKAIIPSGDDTIQAGDSVVVVCTRSQVGDLSDVIL